LGHAHPAVVEAVERQMSRGTSYFLLNEPAIQLAEEIVKAVPCAEQVRYTSSGSEATFFALRVARAFRKREKIMKFEGGFHGTHDYALMSVVPRSPKAFPAPMTDSVEVAHDDPRPGDARQREPPGHDLAVRRQIRDDAVVLLGAAVVDDGLATPSASSSRF